MADYVSSLCAVWPYLHSTSLNIIPPLPYSQDISLQVVLPSYRRFIQGILNPGDKAEKQPKNHSTICFNNLSLIQFSLGSHFYSAQRLHLETKNKNPSRFVSHLWTSISFRFLFQKLDFSILGCLFIPKAKEGVILRSMTPEKKELLRN